MFVRAKKSGAYQYLQLVHNERVDGKVRQQVLATLGRLDVLRETGQIDALIASCGRFAEHTAVLDAHRGGKTAATATITWRVPAIGDGSIWGTCRCVRAWRSVISPSSDRW